MINSTLPVLAPVIRRPGHPMLRILTAFPLACFTGALVTDATYASTANVMWADFSTWLLAAGMAFGVLAALAGGILLLTARRVRPQHPGLLILGSLLVLALGLLDNLVHSRDAWTSVVPTGIALSALIVFLMLLTAWLGSPTVTKDTLILQEPRA